MSIALLGRKWRPNEEEVMYLGHAGRNAPQDSNLVQLTKLDSAQPDNEYLRM